MPSFLSKARRRIQGKRANYTQPGTIRTRLDIQRGEYLERAGGVDEFGIPRGTEPPPADIAPGLQYQHERLNYERNRALEEQARQSLEGGLGLLESYRPGGAAAMASGFYPALSRSYFESRAEPFDMLFDWRRTEAYKARKAARRAGEMEFIGNLFQAGASVAGAALGAPGLPKQPAGPGAGEMPSGFGEGVGGEFGQYGTGGEGDGGGAPLGGDGETGFGGEALFSGAPGGGPLVPLGSPPQGDTSLPAYSGGGTVPLGGGAGGAQGPQGAPPQGGPATRPMQGAQGGAQGQGQAQAAAQGGPAGGPQGGPGAPAGGGGMDGAMWLSSQLYSDWLDDNDEFYARMIDRIEALVAAP